MSDGHVLSSIDGGIGQIRFFHPKKNALPASILALLAEAIDKMGKNDDARLIVLGSEGDGPFCAGASFDELMAIKNESQGKEFFMGFARLILAMKNCPKFIIARIHGKAVGGGVGVAAAADYSLARTISDIKLSELSLGIGPFVVGPAVERKLGFGNFHAMSIDADWRSANWAKQNGLYVETYETISDLHSAVNQFSDKLVKLSPQAMKELKKANWSGTEHWDKLLEERAEISGRLVLSDFTKAFIKQFKERE
ncbi:MAG: enoyl-CoA hydratase/isomerase family protein [Calditrichaeota bacterium]|nr:enoyl-CoA hydratase/isomerase family protein [Calditrichota bacterium]